MNTDYSLADRLFRDVLRRYPHPNVGRGESFSSFTRLGATVGPSILGRVELEHVPPDVLDTLSRCLQAIGTDTRPAGIIPGAINEAVLGIRRIALDIDHPDFTSFDCKAYAYCLGQNLRLHFGGFFESTVLVARNGSGNYHIYLPGLVCDDTVVIDKLLIITNKQLGRHFDIDSAPTSQGHLRLHGTGKVKDGVSQGINSVYDFFCCFDNAGNLIKEDQVDPQYWSLRPSATQIAAYIRDPVAHTPFAASVLAHSAFVPAPGISSWQWDHIASVFRDTPMNAQQWSLAASGVDFFVVRPDSCARRGCEEEEGDSDSESESEEMDVDGCRNAVISVLARIYNGIVYRTAQCSCGRMWCLPTMRFRDSLCRDMHEARPPRVRGPTPVRPTSLLDTPLESIIYPNGLAAATALRVDRSIGEVGTPAMYLLHFCALSGDPLSANDLSGLSYRTFDVAPGDCISPETNKPYMRLAFPARFVAAPNGGPQIRYYEAPCGSGKTALVVATALSRRTERGRILFIAPRRQLCVATASSIERAVANWDATEANLEVQQPGYIRSPLAYPPARVSSHVGKTAQELLECDVVVCTLESLADKAHGEFEAIVLDEVLTTVGGLYTSDTNARNRGATVHRLMRLLASASCVYLLDKDSTPITYMFMALIAVVRRRIAHEEGWRIGPVAFQKYRLGDAVRRSIVEVKSESRCIDKIAEVLRAGHRPIVFESGRKAAERLLIVLSGMFPAKKGLVLTGESHPSLKQEFAKNPIAYLLAGGYDYLIHTSTCDVGISIEHPGGYFHKVFVFARRFRHSAISWRTCMQGSARARELAGVPAGTREITLCRVGIGCPEGPPETRRMETIGSAMRAHEANLYGMEKAVRAGVAQRQVGGSYRVPMDDPFVAFEFAVMQTARLEASLHMDIYRQWVIDNDVRVTVDVGLGSEVTAAAMKAAMEDVEEDEYDRAPLTDDDELGEKRKKMDELALFGLLPSHRLAQCARFMHYAKEGDEDMWSLYAFLQLHAGGIDALRAVEALRTQKSPETSVAQKTSQTGGGMISETILASACVLMTELDAPFDRYSNTFVRASSPAQRTTVLPWEPYLAVDTDEWFTQAQMKPIAHKTGSDTKVRAAICGGRRHRYKNLPKIEVGNGKKERSFCMGVVSAFFGGQVRLKKDASKRGSDGVHPLQLYRRLALLPYWCARMGVDVPDVPILSHPRVTLRLWEDEIL